MQYTQMQMTDDEKCVCVRVCVCVCHTYADDGRREVLVEGGHRKGADARQVLQTGQLLYFPKSLST